VVHPNGALVAAFGGVESYQPLSDQIDPRLLAPLIVSDMPWCRFGFGVTSEEALAESVTALAAEGALCQFLTVRLDFDGPDNTDWLGTIRRQASVSGTYVIASTAIHQKNCGSIGRTIVVNPSGQELACEIAANSIIIVRVDGSEALRVRKKTFVSKPNVNVKAVRQWIWPTAFDYM
jgi:predicted amidohydrolase